MKRIKDFFKNNIKLVLVLIVGLSLGATAVYGADKIFDSDQVGFDNTNLNLTIDGEEVDNVQDAIDALYSKATDYSDILTRLTATEATIGNSTLTTTAQTLTGAVNELNSKMTVKQTMGTTMNIAVYTEYTVPSDGYFKLIKGNNTNTCVPQINGQYMSGTQQNANASMTIFVRKGSRIFIGGDDGDATGMFYPLLDAK